MNSSMGCESCAVHGLFVRQTINEVAGNAGVYALTSLTGNAQKLVAPGAGRVCAGSNLRDGEVPAFETLVEPGNTVDVTIDRAGVARKLGPFAVEGGHVCVLLNPFDQKDMPGLAMPVITPAHV